MSLGSWLQIQIEPHRVRPVRLPRSYSRRGFTLVEVLLVIAIIGLLIALLLPAIQYGREASRRSTCSSNLRQIGLAIGNYESIYEMLPPGSSAGRSLFVRILPYLERTDLAGKVNYSDPLHGADHLQAVVIPTYICPSDGAPKILANGGTPTAGTNYAGSAGVWANHGGFNGMFRPIRSFWPYEAGPVTLADVSDGLSHTSAISEILRADGSGKRLRVPWQLPEYYELGESEMQAFGTACRGLPEYPPAFGWLGDFWERGTPWHRSSFAGTYYNHVLGPNELSCLNQNNLPSAASTASSAHAGGLLVLFGDGHVSYVNEAIEIRAWRSFGARDDNK